MGLAVRINIPAYSEAKILQILQLQLQVLEQPFLKIQNGRHIDIWANANIDFLTYTIHFTKIYSLTNLPKNSLKSI